MFPESQPTLAAAVNIMTKTRTAVADNGAPATSTMRVRKNDRFTEPDAR